MAFSPSAQRRSPHRESQRQWFAWTLLACVLLLGLMAAPYYLGRVYTSDDLWAFHLPVRQFYAQCLARGEAFDWMPSLYCGFYLTGEGQAGTYHPLHWLLYKCLPLHAAFDLELLLSYPFLLAGSYFFFRRHVLRRDAALVGAMVFTFSGFNLLHFVHPNAVAVVAHLPWLLLAMNVVVQETGRSRVIVAEVGIAVLTASQLLLGYPQYVWFSLLTEAAYLLYLGASARGVFLRLLALKLLGLLMGAVQLLPTFDALAESERQSVDAVFAQQGSLHLLNMLQWLGPYLFRDRVVGGNTHEFGLYFGAAPFLLIAWLLWRWGHLGRHRRFAAAALAFGTLALLLALGRHGGLYTLQTYLPLIGKFRLPARYIVLVHFATAALVAVAFADLVRCVERRRRRLRIADCGLGIKRLETQNPQSAIRNPQFLWRLVALSLVLALVAGWVWGEHAAPLLLRLKGPLLLGIAATLLWLAARGRRLAVAALVLFIAADLAIYGFGYAVYPNAFLPSTALSTLPDVESSDPARIATELREPGQLGLRAGNQMVLKGWRQLDGYAGLEPARVLDYRQLPALRVAGVSLVRRSESTESIAGLAPRDTRWLQVPEPLPRARCVTHAIASSNPRMDLPHIPLATAALVEETVTLDAESAPGLAAVSDDRPGKIKLLTETSARQLLVVSERFHAGWQATLDGQPRPVLRVNGEFLGCVVEPGRHQVRFEFQPSSLGYGKLLSQAGLVCLAAWCLKRVQGSGFRILLSLFH